MGNIKWKAMPSNKLKFHWLNPVYNMFPFVFNIKGLGASNVFFTIWIFYMYVEEFSRASLMISYFSFPSFTLFTISHSLTFSFKDKLKFSSVHFDKKRDFIGWGKDINYSSRFFMGSTFSTPANIIGSM